MQPSRHLSILRSGCGEKPSHLTQQMDVLNCQESHSQQRKSCLSRRLRIKRASFLFRNFPSNNRDRQQIPELNFTCPLSLTGRLSQRFLAATKDSSALCNLNAFLADAFVPKQLQPSIPFMQPFLLCALIMGHATLHAIHPKAPKYLVGGGGHAGAHANLQMWSPPRISLCF